MLTSSKYFHDFNIVLGLNYGYMPSLRVLNSVSLIKEKKVMVKKIYNMPEIVYIFKPTNIMTWVDLNPRRTKIMWNVRITVNLHEMEGNAREDSILLPWISLHLFTNLTFLTGNYMTGNKIFTSCFHIMSTLCYMNYLK